MARASSYTGCPRGYARLVQPTLRASAIPHQRSMLTYLPPKYEGVGTRPQSTRALQRDSSVSTAVAPLSLRVHRGIAADALGVFQRRNSAWTLSNRENILTISGGPAEFARQIRHWSPACSLGSLLIPVQRAPGHPLESPADNISCSTRLKGAREGFGRRSIVIPSRVSGL